MSNEAEFDMVSTALAYARRGLAIFPIWSALPSRDGFICSCGRLTCKDKAKHPIGALVRHGLKDATTDEVRVRRFWTAHPAANIGAATGQIVGLDIDPRHGGEAALAELETKHGALPSTWRVNTGGGGLHVYFRAPPLPVIVRNSVGKLGPGIDVRGHGGYVLLPPSLHISGRRYTWQSNCAPDQLPLAQLPLWITTALIERSKPGRPPAAWSDIAASTVTEGARNDTVARFAGHLLRRYIDPHVVLELLLAWNQARCKPPLAHADIVRTVNSIAGKELRRRSA
jgi:hypothetical protein